MRKSAETIGIILNIRTTVSVNGILYGIRHLPIIGKYLSDRIYGMQILKLAAFLISLLRGIFTAFFGRFCMFVFLFLASGAISSLNDYSQRTVYLYGFLFLCLLGTLLQYYFQADQAGRDTVFSLGMDAKQYIRALFILKTFTAVAGYILFGIPSAMLAGVPWYLALLIPLSGAGFRAAALGLRMKAYAAKQAGLKRKGGKGEEILIEGNSYLTLFLVTVISVAGFIAGPFVVYLDLYPFTVILLLLSALLLIPGLKLIRSFPYGLYRTAMNAEYRSMQITKEKEKKKKNPELEISPTEGIRSGAGGYRFLNELFLKRHRKILWGRMFLMILFTAAGLALTSLFLRGELKEAENVKDSVLRFIVCRHPGVFPILLLTLNAGGFMTRVMYANCDSSLLKFSFYRSPVALRKMFRLRLVSVIRYNLIPALLIAGHSVAVIALTGGQEYFFQYGFTVLAVLLMQVFISVRYLIIYYLIQPFAGNIPGRSRLTEFLNFVLCIVCFILPFTRLSALQLTLACMVLTGLYILLGDLLVSRIGPKTFQAK
ncbi:MAG: hypothetical protein IK115_07360 [Lachnospiraceae bacterium]|nr:hypothetical protein [Lachnospiraceae bacterium]